MSERVPDPMTLAVGVWEDMVAEARAAVTLALLDQDVTLDGPGSDLVDVGVVAGINAALEVLTRTGMLR